MQYIPNTIPGYAPDYFGAGKNGFQDGDAATGVQGTEIAAEVWNDWLGNLMKICELAGVATAPGQFTDLANGVLGLAAGQTVAAINADAYPIVGTDIGKLLNYGTTAGAFTSSLPDVGALPARFKVDLRCEGPYALTVNAHAGNTIEGQTSVVIYAGEVVTFVPFGTVWKAFKRRSGLYVPGWQLFLTGSSTFTVPPGVYRLTSLLWGGGGSGIANGGNGGGAGGFSVVRCTVTPGATIPVTVGGGGGQPGGNPGASSSFGSFHSATGGTASVTAGIGVGGDFNYGGAQGSTATGGLPGMGGGAPFGGAGGGFGQGGQVPGGGGSGGTTPGNPAGGGAAGASLVFW